MGKYNFFNYKDNCYYLNCFDCIKFFNFIKKKETLEKSPRRLNVGMILKGLHDYLSQYSFFLVAVIFLIFDVEITLIIPMPLIITTVAKSLWLVLSCLFVVILVVGTLHEWNEGSLDWTK